MGENNVPPWATAGRKVRLKTGAERGEIEKITPSIARVAVPGDFVTMPIRLLVAEWEPDDAPAEQPSRSLAETMGAVLHELRASGPLGLDFGELRERLSIARSALTSATERLAFDGRVVWVGQDTASRLQISACQRALDEAERERGLLGAQLDHERTQMKSEYERSWGEVDKLRAIVGARALADAGQAAEAFSARHLIGRRLFALAVAAKEEPLAYQRGLHDAAYVASYGAIESSILTVRIVFPDNTTSTALLLADTGPERDAGDARFVLGSGRHHGKRLRAKSSGEVCGSPVRIHADDLARLHQSEEARGQHGREDASADSDCQRAKSDRVVAAEGGA